MPQIDVPVRQSIDESWMPEWLECGYQQITDYLAKHDAYLAYCAEHELEP
jgi:hypothetical protein